MITGTGGTAIDAGNHAGNLSLVNRGAINGSIAFGAGNDALTLFTGQRSPARSRVAPAATR